MRLAAAVLCSASVLSGAAAQEPAPYEVDGRRSGYLYLTEETRALQDDEFLNPGMFALEDGEALWNEPDGSEGLSCASCHGDPAQSMRGVAARYPVYEAARDGLVNLELRINEMRAEYMGAEPYPYESDPLLSLTAFVALQSRGMPVSVGIEGPAAPFFEEGRAFYETRRGQLDLACSHCHDGLAGEMLRGDLLSQGQVNGFPIYRMLWSGMGSRHRMFQWCNVSLRAEPYPLGSEEYLALELYMAWRARGLPVEAPAVRR
jgi:L-cysteine S-thiosulfotransferase